MDMYESFKIVKEKSVRIKVDLKKKSITMHFHIYLLLDWMWHYKLIQPPVSAFIILT